MAGKKSYKSWVSVADKQMEDAPQKINAIDFIEGPVGLALPCAPSKEFSLNPYSLSHSTTAQLGLIASKAGAWCRCGTSTATN